MAKMTQAQLVAQYAKEYDRIRKQVERMGKRGYDVSGIKPERVAKKDITRKDLQKLQKLTNEEIYKKAGGEQKQKEELSRRAKKGWRTRRRTEDRKSGWQKSKVKHPEAPRISHELPRPEQPPTPEPPEPEPLPPGPDKGLTDEEQAALDRFEELFDSFIDDVRKSVKNWENNMIARLGGSIKKFAAMIAKALNDGLILMWYPPSQQYSYSVQVMEMIQSYLPSELTNEEKEQSEDEWNDLIQQMMDSEDFLPFD